MNRPNILFLHVDQMHRDAIATYGHNRFVQTPNLDRLAQQGHSFMKSYTPMPQCVPARSSWMTGRMSKEHGAPHNKHTTDPSLPDLGVWLREKGGYESVYSGKWHIHGRDVAKSFKLLSRGHGMGEWGDPHVTRTAVSFLQNYSGEKPFFFSIGLLNPHDCCYAAAANGGIGKFGLAEKIEDRLPDLPENFDHDFANAFHGWRVADWTLRDWRYYIFQYNRMVEMVDAEVGRICDALRGSKFGDNTLLIFTSDHGDGCGFHGMISKGFLYDEVWRVPTIVSWPGVVESGVLDDEHLMSGVDIPATICDYAQVEPLPKMTVGRSLRPVFEDSVDSWREYVVGETSIGDLRTAIRDSSAKTIFYANGKRVVFDMERDPFEMNDLADTDQGRVIAARHRDYFRDYLDRIEIYRGPAKVAGNLPKTPENHALLNREIEEYCQWYDGIKEGRVEP